MFVEKIVNKLFAEKSNKNVQLEFFESVALNVANISDVKCRFLFPIKKKIVVSKKNCN